MCKRKKKIYCNGNDEEMKIEEYGPLHICTPFILTERTLAKSMRKNIENAFRANPDATSQQIVIFFCFFCFF